MRLSLQPCSFVLFAVALSAEGCTGTTPATAPTAKQVAAPTTGPRLEIKQTTRDAGEVDFSIPSERKFTVRNVGDEPLVLTLTGKSCFCTDATVPEPIAPGQEGVVAVRWTPIPGKSGSHRVFAEFETNDRRKPTVRLEVTGVVNPLIRIAPEDLSYIDFYRLEPGAVKPRELKVFSTKLSAFDLEARTDLPALKVTKTKLEVDESSRIGDAKPRCAYSVLLETTPQLPSGSFATDLVLTLKPPDVAAREIRMRVYGVVANGIFKVLPEDVEFKTPRLADGEVQKVRVQFLDPGKKQTLKIVRVEPAFVQCDGPRLLPGAAGQWEFTASVPPKNADAARVQANRFFEGQIVLQASGSDAQIPVRVKWNPPEPVEKR
ncbi:MAG TPA: DUF1573 domain-containing protein [Gemmataceae bacterium]|nr:DUF1573 domain-containing protein [Gemmataceae bacterium]